MTNHYTTIYNLNNARNLLTALGGNPDIMMNLSDAKIDGAIEYAFSQAKLTDREKQILMLRKGLVDSSSHTLKDIGRIIGLTRERVRQIEEKSLMKIIPYLRSNAEGIIGVNQADWLKVISEDNRKWLIESQQRYRFNSRLTSWRNYPNYAGSVEDFNYAKSIEDFVAEIHNKYPVILEYLGTHVGITRQDPPETANLFRDERERLDITTEIPTDEFLWDCIDWNSHAKNHGVRVDIDDVLGEYLWSFKGAQGLASSKPDDLFTVVFVAPKI